MHVIDVIRDGGRSGSDAAGSCHSHADSGHDQRGPKSKRGQNQTGDGRHAAHGGGGAPGDACDLGLMVELADVVGDGVERDDVLPEDLGPLREDLVEDPQAALHLVRQDGERPGFWKLQQHFFKFRIS